MKTVGQILKSERLKRNLSLEHLSSLTKIDTKYLDALENDDYSKLPSETFIKGFIRNISLRLDRDPQELISVFRRDFRHPQKNQSESHLHRPVKFGPSLLSSQIFPFLIGGIIFIVYLVFQFRAILTPPPLDIASPTPGSVLVSPIEITGHTEVGSQITINGDTQAKPDSEGNFVLRLSLPVGETEIEVSITNRFGRNTVKKIPLTIISK